MSQPLSKTEVEGHALAFSNWLERELEGNPGLDSVEENRAECQWFVRILGTAKKITSIKYRLDQRTLSFESYVMPFPEENVAEFLELILRLNSRMYGAAFVIGMENGIYLSGQIRADAASDPDEMDRIMGSMYAWSEDNFERLIRLGYTSRF